MWLAIFIWQFTNCPGHFDSTWYQNYCILDKVIISCVDIKHESIIWIQEIWGLVGACLIHFCVVCVHLLVTNTGHLNSKIMTLNISKSWYIFVQSLSSVAKHIETNVCCLGVWKKQTNRCFFGSYPNRRWAGKTMPQLLWLISKIKFSFKGG